MFGRGSTGARLGDRWANDPSLGADLCRHHHGAMHAVVPDRLLEQRLMHIALNRFALAHGVHGVDVEEHRHDLVTAARRLVEVAEATGQEQATA